MAGGVFPDKFNQPDVSHAFPFLDVMQSISGSEPRALDLALGGKSGRGGSVVKLYSVLLPVLSPLVTGHASTHAHVGRGRMIQDAAREDTEMRIRIWCCRGIIRCGVQVCSDYLVSTPGLRPMPDTGASAHVLERAGGSFHFFLGSFIHPPFSAWVQETTAKIPIAPLCLCGGNRFECLGLSHGWQILIIYAHTPPFSCPGAGDYRKISDCPPCLYGSS